MYKLLIQKYWMPSFFFLSVFLILSTTTPSLPTDGLDPSWEMGMGQALAQGLQIGKDIIFTFGPYSGIYTKLYEPKFDSLIWISSIFWALIAAISLYYSLQEWKKPVLIFLSTLIIIFYSDYIDAIYILYPYVVCILFFKNGAKNYSLLTLQLITLGLMPLIKASFILSCILSTTVMAAHAASERNLRQLFIIILIPIISFLFFWIVSFQSLENIPLYLKNSGLMIHGYTQAMNKSGPEWQVNAFILILTAATYLLTRYNNKIGFVNFYLFTLLQISFLFILFKYGFIRHDQEHAIAATFGMTIYAIILHANYERKFSLILVITCLILLIETSRYYFGLTNMLTQSIFTIKERYDPENLAKRFHAIKLFETYQQSLVKISQKNSLPKLNGSTDIYSHNQAGLISSGNSWNPRPIFQSYAAYTPELIEMNFQHLLGNRASDHVIFSIEPIDRRLPSLEDGKSWPVFLKNYHLSKEHQDFLIFDRKTVGRNNIIFTEINNFQVRFGEKILPPSDQELLFTTITIEPNILGKFLNFVYKTRTPRISLKLKNDDVKTFDLIPNMANSHFLISPLIEKTAEFSLLYKNDIALKEKSVTSFSIHAEGSIMTWSDQINVRFFTINNFQ